MRRAGKAKPAGRRRFIKIRLESLTDLALLVSELPLRVIEYSEPDGVYFTVLGGYTVYYVKGAEPPSKRFIHLDISGRYSFADSISFEPNHETIAILRVKEHSLGHL